MQIFGFHINPTGIQIDSDAMLENAVTGTIGFITGTIFTFVTMDDFIHLGKAAFTSGVCAVVALIARDIYRRIFPRKKSKKKTHGES